MKSSFSDAPKNPSGSQVNHRQGSTEDSAKRGEIATVVHYYTDTYRAVVAGEGGTFTAQRLRSTMGEIAPLPKGAEVLVSHDYGAPLIMGIVNYPASKNQESETHSVTGITGIGGQGENKDPNPENGNFRRANEPTDTIPGDQIYMGAQGNLIGILQAGINILKSSSLAQIQTMQTEDLVRIISRNYEHISDMGRFDIKNNDGRISMTFRAGTDQKSETGIDEENWTIRMDIGGNGDSFNFEVTTPLGQTLFRLGVDGDGRCEIYGINGLSLNSGNINGGAHQEEFNGNSQANYRGNRTETIEGAHTVTTGGSHVERARGDYAISSNNDARFNALRDIGFGTGRNFAVAVTGNLLDPLGSAVNFDVSSGNFDVNLASVANPLNSFNIITTTGNLNFESDLGGNVTLNSLLGKFESTFQQFKVETFTPNSVVLGGSVLVSHVAMFEQLKAYLDALHVALDKHTHVITGTAGPFPVTGTTLPPTVPIGSPLSGLAIAIGSRNVGVGG